MDLGQIAMKPLLLIAIAVAAATVYLPFLVVGAARLKAGYDVNAPRALFDQLPDWGKRATWAHQNGWESFVLFTAAALMAYVAGVDSGSARVALGAYLVARVMFAVFYIGNIGLLRSLMFGIGTASIFTLMSESIRAALAAG
ncbi:MAG: hypothetical protein RLZZ511_3216 [Cyanobacteriota bacterium]|jgi:uncharacterized MAPEG superfamily protein